MSRSLAICPALKEKVKVFTAHSCPALWTPVDCSLPGSSVHGIAQAGYWGGLPCP